MVRMTWSSLSANGPAFHIFRRDDAVYRTLQGSQVAVHEYRMAYDNLLTATKLERDGLVRDKRQLEEELHALTIAKAEADRLLKGQISGLHAGLRASEQAYSELDAEHQRLRNASTGVTNELLQRVDSLQQTVADLQTESQSLQKELTSVQAEAALKDAAMQQVAQLQSSMSALQQRASQLVADLKQRKNKAEKRAAELSNHLTATHQQLAQEMAARTSNDDYVRRLAWERQQLASALELERLINEPLRHTSYAVSTTLAHVMRSPVAPTVADRASPDRHVDRVPHLQQQQHPHCHLQVPKPLMPPSPDVVHARRPGSAPPVAEAATAAMARAALGDLSGRNVTLSPQSHSHTHFRKVRGAAKPGFITGRNLTRLGRSWATTTAAAGPPHPWFLDNLNSHLAPPPPGAPRKAITLAAPSSTPRSGGARSASAGGPGAGTGYGSPRGGGNAASAYFSPTYLTAMLRSPQTPHVQDSTVLQDGYDVLTESPVSPTFLWRGAPSSPSSIKPQAVVASSASSSPSRSGGGRLAMWEEVKEPWSGGGAPPVVLTPGGTPITIVYA